MPLLEYQEGKTLLHKASPTTKFLWGMIVLLWLFLMFDPLHVLVLGVVIFAVAKFAAGLSLIRLIRTSLTVGIGGLFIIVLQGVFFPGETVLFRIGPLQPTLEGINVGLAIALRILAIVAASAVIAKTTDPRDVFLSLVQIGIPYNIAYGLFAAIRFIPLMEYEAETIREAQMVRGVASQRGGLKSIINQVRNFLVPFIACGVRRAQQSAVALEVRAFGLHPTRTYLREVQPSKGGWIFVAVWAVALLAYIVLSQQNVLGAVFFEPPK